MVGHVVYLGKYCNCCTSWACPAGHCGIACTITNLKLKNNFLKLLIFIIESCLGVWGSGLAVVDSSFTDQDFPSSSGEALLVYAASSAAALLQYVSVAHISPGGIVEGRTKMD